MRKEEEEGKENEVKGKWSRSSRLRGHPEG